VNRSKRAAWAVVVAVMAVMLTGCFSVPSDMAAVEVEESPTQARKVVGCKPPATRGFWTNNEYNLFPTSEREWDATGQDGSDSGRFTSVTKDNVEMYVPVTVRFTLITECDTLKSFYTKYARRFGVEFKDNGEYNAAWITVLRKLVKDPTDTTLDRIVQDYNWRDVWNNPKIKPEIERRLDEALQSDNSLLVQTAHKRYFDNISVLVGRAEPVQAELAEAVALEQTNVAKAQSAEAQAKADEAKARAQIAVARAEGEKRRAEVAGYGGIDGYLKALCIQTSGCNPYPSPIIPGFSVAK
jgi:regulator of protease activity HflC (stomatin/prohibitin superfamily)